MCSDLKQPIFLIGDNNVEPVYRIPVLIKGLVASMSKVSIDFNNAVIYTVI